MKFAFSLLLFALLLTACQPADTAQNKKLHTLSGPAQGTTFSIRYVSADTTNYAQAVDSILRSIDNSLSTYVPNSTLMEFNRADKFTTADPHFIRMLFESKGIQQISNGAFDPAVMPLVKAWGFGPEGPAVKQNQNIDSLLQLVKWDFDMTMTEQPVSGSTATKTVVEIVKKTPVQFDFNAIAQGYTVDVLFEFFRNKSISDLMVEVGGEVRASGTNDQNNKWRIGVDKPLDSGERDLQAVAEIDNRAIATSGNYRKFYEKDGQRYAHTINPKTGYPVQHNLLSATVVAETCAMADAYATVFMVLGLDESIEFINAHPDLGLKAYLIYNDPQGNIKTHYTPGMQDVLKEVE